MNNPKEDVPFLKELKDFLQFLQNLWTILAGISVLFPLSNALAKIIPLARWPEGGLAYFSPQLLSIVSSLACLFLLLWMFGHRYQLERRRIQTQRKAGLSFAAGLIALIIYLTVYFAIANDFYFEVLKWESDDLRRVLGDIILLITYSAFFVLMTQAFMLLGMLEYFGRKSHTA
ncbi:MAG: hypothetical protein FD168_208 [Desulfobulbaceae bacterium]|jgi:hypothetical protein|nr:MAG: hypothetical protein FD168_208 [Desulfobulbaceae bacterium]